MMMKTFEVLLGIILMFSILFLSVKMTENPNASNEQIKEQVLEAVDFLSKQDAFRQKVLTDQNNAIKTSLNELVKFPLKISVCNNLGENTGDCQNVSSDKNQTVTINYFIASDSNQFKAKTLRVIAEVGK